MICDFHAFFRGVGGGDITGAGEIPAKAKAVRTVTIVVTIATGSRRLPRLPLELTMLTADHIRDSGR